MRSGSPHQDGTVPQIGTAWECVRVVKFEAANAIGSCVQRATGRQGLRHVSAIRERGLSRRPAGMPTGIRPLLPRIERYTYLPSWYTDTRILARRANPATRLQRGKRTLARG